MRIIGYTFDADVHCPDCTRHLYPALPGAKPDEHGVDTEARDTRGNPIHPIFNTDESPETDDHCGDCHVLVAAAYRGGCNVD